ncbi:MAG: acetyl-CoA hydrolase/transferase family protein [Fimbriimonadaceae bacterium]|nr:acetyl-CoA hydrolase/transferase family protein [Fimbriimonadaceae bacterium]QYK58662.1 MAG: acetyl-CoA hydrolase/transferase family protein [Fimbriimonadaceae bacterium]
MSTVSPDEAVSEVRSRQRIYVHGMSAFPRCLMDALVARADELRGVEIVHLHTEGDATYARPEFQDSFFVNNLFIGSNVRQAVAEGRADYVPVFLSEIPALFRKGVMPLDWAFVTVSPPDKHGCVSLGVSVDCSLAAVESAERVVAQVNPNMPRTHGDGNLPVSMFHQFVEVDHPLIEMPPPPMTERDVKIGARVAELVEDGATLQMGIGAIPNAVLAALSGHRRLGVHTEMFSDGLVDLVESGVVTGEEKTLYRGKVVSGFVSGTKRLYDFVDDNPRVLLLDIANVNDTSAIRKLPKMTAINSAIEIDLTGQVCADSIGTKLYSGVGGQMDFVRGASLSPGGKPIFALPSTTSKGESRIVPVLKPGAGVVTTRAHVHFVVTEHGVADLYGKNLRQRATALIDIAHPDHREALERAAVERFHR